jgi:hypothetical protein
VVEFTCKCVICGHVQTFTESQIDPVLGPACPKCYGPMTTERVMVKQSQANRGTKP